MLSCRKPNVAVDDLPGLIAREFEEQPGLCLTFAQVQRLWALSPGACRDALEYLTRSGVLVCGEGSRYRRADAAQSGPGHVAR